MAKHSVKYQSKYARAGRFLAVRFNLGVGTALFEHYLGTLLDFVWREIFLVSCNEPDMPERIFQRARPNTVKLILHWSDGLGACINGLGKHRVHVFHVHVKANWRAT